MIAFDFFCRRVPHRLAGVLLLIILALPELAGGISPAPPCGGDCDGSGQVTISELITGVRIALGTEGVAACGAMDQNSDGQVTISELVGATGAALRGCPATPRPTVAATGSPSAAPTATDDVPATASPTPSASPTPTLQRTVIALAIDIPPELPILPASLRVQAGITAPVAPVDDHAEVEIVRGYPTLVRADLVAAPAGARGTETEHTPLFLGIAADTHAALPTLGPESTAVTLVFLNLHLYAEPRATYEASLQLIADTPAVTGPGGLASVLTAELAADPGALAHVPANPRIAAALSAATAAVGEQIVAADSAGGVALAPTCTTQAGRTACFSPAATQSGVTLTLESTGVLRARNAHGRFATVSAAGPTGTVRYPSLFEGFAVPLTPGAVAFPSTYHVDTYGGLRGLVGEPGLLLNADWQLASMQTLFFNVVIPLAELTLGFPLDPLKQIGPDGLPCMLEFVSAMQVAVELFVDGGSDGLNATTLWGLVTAALHGFSSDPLLGCVTVTLTAFGLEHLATFLASRLGDLFGPIVAIIRIAAVTTLHGPALVEWATDAAHDAFVVEVHGAGVTPASRTPTVTATRTRTASASPTTPTTPPITAPTGATTPSPTSNPTVTPNLPGGVTLSVPAIADIALAGQPEGVTVGSFCGTDTAPTHAAVAVGLTVEPRLVVQFSNVSGSVRVSGSAPAVQADGQSDNMDSTARAHGLSRVTGPRGALIGVFLTSDQPTSFLSPPDLNFSGAARDVPLLAPLLQQPFFIGRGQTSEGMLRQFVVPERATRLFLGVLDDGGCNANNSGSFSLTVSLAPPPPSPTPGGGRVFGIADIALAGQSPGVVYSTFAGEVTAPLNAPTDLRLPLVAGQAVQFTSISGTVNVSGNLPQTPPDGDPGNDDATGRLFGLSRVVGPRGALIGIFLSDDVPSTILQPPDLNFTGAAVDVPTIAPLLQQPFLIGRGRTSEGVVKRFIVPDRAARLLLAVLEDAGGTANNTGFFDVTATLSTPPPSPAPGQVRVYAISDVVLADKAPGTVYSTFAGEVTAPLNAAVDARLPLVPGQVVQFPSVSGMVSVTGNTPQTPADGDAGNDDSTAQLYGVSRVIGPRGALVGLFLADPDPTESQPPPDLNFTGAAADLPLVSPLLRQAFYIGRGRTSSGVTKSFTVPPLATRLFLAVLEDGGGNANNTGFFDITAVLAPPPPSPTPGRPRVPAVADIALAGQPPGIEYSTFAGAVTAPLNAPSDLGITLTGGQTVQVLDVTGSVSVVGNTPQTQADGDAANNDATSRLFGLSRVIGPRGALVGVFLNVEIPTAITPPPPDLDFSAPTAREQEMLQPLLRQPFFIGRGRTSAGVTKRFFAPAGATRLLLGILEDGGGNANNTGAFDVHAVVE